MKGRPRRRRRGGFTIVEIIVVVIIIAALATMIAPKLLGRVGQAKSTVAAQHIQALEQAIDLFCTDYERMPESLDELVERPDDIPAERWNPPTVKVKDLNDPWGRPYQYVCPGEHNEGSYDLFTLGRDGQTGGQREDADVTNWQ
ncbi:MAG: type II secretion system major pseudopilin GspG [Planctomycetes bacterium]|nr:type II secretion system major pseudopilin GspG [Planctomycetota bacterium]